MIAWLPRTQTMGAAQCLLMPDETRPDFKCVSYMSMESSSALSKKEEEKKTKCFFSFPKGKWMVDQVVRFICMLPQGCFSFFLLLFNLSRIYAYQSWSLVMLRPFVASRQGFFKEERGFYNSRYNPLLSSKRGEGASMGLWGFTLQVRHAWVILFSLTSYSQRLTWCQCDLPFFSLLHLWEITKWAGHLLSNYLWFQSCISLIMPIIWTFLYSWSWKKQNF